VRGDGTISLFGHPLEAVVAEKVASMLERSKAHTRVRDFRVVMSIGAHHALIGDRLWSLIDVTAAHRGHALRRLSGDLGDLAVQPCLGGAFCLSRPV
jgi:hypothetical protein